MPRIPSIAIIQFPGLNTEYETRREINASGMRGEFFRWNDDPKRLGHYDGFILPGGFSYEDRGRAGLVASMDPFMAYLIKETEKGKPLLGICNGAQMTVETGMVPGTEGYKLAMSLARNKRIQDGKVLGTGYYNDWIYMKSVAPKGRTAFTLTIDDNTIFNVPVAHGEGRFTTILDGLLNQLIHNQQAVFRYCDRDGAIKNEFPVNPNGALYNLAAVCNPQGNVMATMPHHERSAASRFFFESMREYILGRKITLPRGVKARLPVLRNPERSQIEMPAQYTQSANAIRFFVDLIITDNEAETIEAALHRRGFTNISLKRQTYYELVPHGSFDLLKLTKQLVQSGVLLNTNKEIVTMQSGKKHYKFDKGSGRWMEAKTAQTDALRLLSMEKQDFVGLAKTNTIRNRLKLSEIEQVKSGVLWHVTIDTKNQKEKERIIKQLIKLHVFSNPHAQDIACYSA